MDEKSTYEELEYRVKVLEREAVWRKQAEDALRKSEEKYRQHFVNVSDVIYSIDSDFRVISVSPSVERILGYKPEELIGRPFQDLNILAPEYLEKAFSETMRVLAGERIDSSEYEFISKDGIRKFGEVSFGPLVRDGKVIAVISVARDITKRKQVEEALRESEEKYRTVLEASPDPVVVYDMEGKVIYFNPAFTHVFGWTLEERLGKKMDYFVPDKAWPETKMMIEKLLAGESFFDFETRRYTKEGNIIPVSISGAIYRDQNGNPAGSIINLRDITEQKRLELQLLQAHKMEAIGTLAGGIAHDFNNILWIINGNMELIADEIPDGNPAHYNLKEVEEACQRATDLVTQILSFSRQTEQKLQPLKISSIVKESLKLLRSTIPTTIEISQNISTDSYTILADLTQINQLLLNLYTNAANAMREKGGLLEVSLTDTELDKDEAGLHQDLSPGKYVILTVLDTGHGIDPEIVPSIFDPYFTTKGLDGGTGMGLSVACGIVKSHGGAITVHSEPGKGASFHVFLPIIDEVEVKPESETFETLPKGNERILFVDDEKAVLAMGKQILKSLGYEVAVSQNSIEALKSFRAQPEKYDLVITDQTMPHITGEDLARELMSIWPDIPVILCTGYSELVSEEKAKAIGIKAFLLKPIVKGELANKIREVLDQS